MAATTLVFGLNAFRTATHQNSTSLDFVNYAQFITPMKLHGTITKPHFIYPMLVAAASIVFPGISYSGLGAGVVLIFQLLLASILWVFWKQMIPERAPSMTAFTLTLISMMLAPVSMLTLFKHNLYIGYIAITIYHNPPIIICRPIALLHFLIFAKVISTRTFSTRQIVFCFLTIVIATLMKPNYAIIMLPTAMIFAGWAIFKKDSRLFNFVSFGTILPSLLVLAWQYYFTYVTSNSETNPSHIIFAPFLVYAVRSHYLLLRFILSVFFPATALILYWKDATKDRFYWIGFLLFIFGAAQSYFLAESGIRLYDGNFFWSGQLGLFFWFIVSMRLVLKEIFSNSIQTRGSGKFIALYITFSLHVVSGILWYAYETIAPGTFW